MYSTFTLKKTDKGIIQGYTWPLEEPAKVVCIIHGIGEYAGRYDRVAEAFRSKRIAVLSMDLRGHGNSVGPKGHCAPRKDVLDDVSELILYARRMYPDRDIVLYGHSMGGNIALDYRSRGQFNDIPSKYLISAPWIRLVQSTPKPLYSMAKAMSRIVPSAGVSSAVDEELLGNPESVQPYSTNPMVHNRISFLCAIEGFDTGKALEQGKLEDNGAAANIPTMIMHGTNDGICDITGTRKVYENLKRKGNKVEMIEWPGFLHEIHNGNEVSRGDEVIDSMIQFILG